MSHHFRVVYNAYHQSHANFNKFVISADVVVKVDIYYAYDSYNFSWYTNDMNLGYISMTWPVVMFIHTNYILEFFYTNFFNYYIYVSTRIVDTASIHFNVRYNTRVTHDFVMKRMLIIINAIVFNWINLLTWWMCG